MKKTGVLIVLGLVLAFGIPLVRWATPGGDRGPDTFGGVLLYGGLTAAVVLAGLFVRRKVGARAMLAGRELREKHEGREREPSD